MVLQSKIVKIKIYDNDELEKTIKKYKDDIDIIENDNIKDEEKIEDYNGKIKNILEKLVHIDADEDDIKMKINKSNFNFKETRNVIINKINNKMSLEDNDKKNIVKLLSETDYEQILETMINNKKYKKDLHKFENNIKIIKKRKNKNYSKLNDIKRNYEKTNILYSTNKENMLIDNDNKKYKKILKEKKSLYEENKNKLKSSNEKLKLFMKLSNENEKLNENEKRYEKYLEQKEHNEKIMKDQNVLKEDINNTKKLIHDYTSNENEIKILTNDLGYLMQKQTEYEQYCKNYEKQHDELLFKEGNIKNLDYNKKEYKKITNDLYESKLKYNNNLNSLDILNKNLEEYKNNKILFDKLSKEKEYLDKQIIIHKEYVYLSSIKGLPSIIINEKLPMIEKNVNKILNKYTNFNIKMYLKGNGNSKKLNIIQVKNNINEKDQDNKKLSIKSCSGYEMVVLNIVFKLVIRKLCYINDCSFLCIDEVLSKISNKNYDKLNNIFDMIEDNYDNIFIISHIEEIKTILDEKYSGKNINIEKDENNISYIKN